MAQYHLYFLRDGQLVGGDRIEARDDQDAARIGLDRGEGRVVEVWNDHKRIRVIAPEAVAAAG